ncbi:hypothetical protein WA026_000251 [Henosepilachna vigintioctopunctata]|uniref:Major facilitator superfamily (MFS) profile domain-containing protein n=1 Tax=Henosepilachna vigintioctopunctata TaxID=420089 RepID=A0AAW1V3K6_9CUCU
MVDECLMEPPAKGFGIRHWQVILHFFFYVIIDGTKMSIAGTIPYIIRSPDGSSNWSTESLSLAVSSYLFGFLITGLFGGWLCKKCGFKWPMVITMVIISVITLNLPLITREYGHQGLIACRLIQGLCAGLVYPMPADFISRWIPVQERTVLGTIIYASGRIGDVIGMYMPIYLAETSLGWSFIYTQYGYIAVIWAILMGIFGADSPEEYPKAISEEELNYIVRSRGNAKPLTKIDIPWKRMLTSSAFWSIVIAQIGALWLFNVEYGNLMVFLNIFYDVRIRSGAFLIVLSISWIFTFIYSAVAQLFIKENKTTIGQSRKIFNTIGCLVPSVILILYLILPASNPFVGVFLFTILSIGSVATIVGSKLNINDITGNFAPIIFAVANWMGIVFTVVFTLLINIPFVDTWTVVFVFTIILLILTNLFFLKFGSGEDQMWESYEEVRDEESELSKSTSRASNDERKYLLFIKKH